MKKITLLFTLLTASVVFSQDLVLGFETGETGGIVDSFGNMANPMIETGTGSNTSKVAKFVATGGSEVWQGSNINLTFPVQLTTTKSMTIDVLASEPTTFLVKVLDGGPEAAAEVTHNGNGLWQTLTFTFNTALDGKAAEANGTYSKFVIHAYWTAGATTFAGVPTPARTFYVDNIKGVKGTPPASSAPTTAAMAPPVRPSTDVVSIYSNAYSNISPITLDAGWCGGGAVAPIEVAGNNILAYKGNDCQGITFPSDTRNLNGFTNIHVDFYVAAGTDLVGKVITLKIVPNTGGSAAEIIITIDINALSPLPVAGTWYSFDRAFTAGELAAIAANPVMHEFAVSSNLKNMLWYDNLYIHKNTLGTQKFETANVKMYPNPVKNSLNIEANAAIQKVSVYNVLGQEVLKSSPKSNKTTLQTNQIQKGIYVVKTEIDGKTTTTKVVKE